MDAYDLHPEGRHRGVLGAGGGGGAGASRSPPLSLPRAAVVAAERTPEVASRRPTSARPRPSSETGGSAWHAQRGGSGRRKRRHSGTSSFGSWLFNAFGGGGGAGGRSQRLSPAAEVVAEPAAQAEPDRPLAARVDFDRRNQRIGSRGVTGTGSRRQVLKQRRVGHWRCGRRHRSHARGNSLSADPRSVAEVEAARWFALREPRRSLLAAPAASRAPTRQAAVALGLGRRRPWLAALAATATAAEAVTAVAVVELTVTASTNRANWRNGASGGGGGGGGGVGMNPGLGGPEAPGGTATASSTRGEVIRGSSGMVSTPKPSRSASSTKAATRAGGSMRPRSTEPSNAYTLTATTGAIALGHDDRCSRAAHRVGHHRRLHARGDQHGPGSLFRQRSDRSCLPARQARLSRNGSCRSRPGSVALSGQNAGLGKGQRVVASPSALSVAGSTTGLAVQRKGRCVRRGRRAVRDDRGPRSVSVFLPQPERLPSRARPPALRAQRKLTVSVSSESLAGTSAGLLAQRGVAASSRSVDLSGTPTAILFGGVLAAAAAAALLVGNAAGLTKSGGDHPIVAGKLRSSWPEATPRCARATGPLRQRSTVIQTLLSSRVQGISLGVRGPDEAHDEHGADRSERHRLSTSGWWATS